MSVLLINSRSGCTWGHAVLPAATVALSAKYHCMLRHKFDASWQHNESRDGVIHQMKLLIHLWLVVDGQDDLCNTCCLERLSARGLRWGLHSGVGTTLILSSKADSYELLRCLQCLQRGWRLLQRKEPLRGR
jgi:hypothetical protein